MNQEKIGKFILEMRKQKGLTQKELAEKVGISDKTISKWECGNSMPDISYLEALCTSLDITVNELLSGECLSDESYSEKAEENIMALMKENESNKKSGFLKIISGILLICASFAILILNSHGELSFIGYYFDGIALTVFILLCVAGVILSGRKTKLEVCAVLQKIAIPSGVLVALFQFVLMLRRLDDLAAIGPNVAISTLAVMYGLVTYLAAAIVGERGRTSVETE